MQKLLEFARNIQVEENNMSYEILYPVWFYTIWMLINSHLTFLSGFYLVKGGREKDQNLSDPRNKANPLIPILYAQLWQNLTVLEQDAL